MIITIDGLSTTGKSTLSKMIAKALKIKNFNTGTIYRCIAYEILEKKLDIAKIDDVIFNLKGINIDFVDDKVLLNGIDVTRKIRENNISVLSTKYATIPEIKEFVRNYQKDFIKNNDTVMEGRDIGTRIAPNADFRFYLYSNFETRVERLYKKDNTISKEKIAESLKIIDDLDINEGNFIEPENAIRIDTTNLNLEEVYNIMMDIITKKIPSLRSKNYMKH